MDDYFQAIQTWQKNTNKYYEQLVKEVSFVQERLETTNTLEKILAAVRNNEELSSTEYKLFIAVRKKTLSFFQYLSDMKEAQKTLEESIKENVNHYTQEIEPLIEKNYEQQRRIQEKEFVFDEVAYFILLEQEIKNYKEKTERNSIAKDNLIFRSEYTKKIVELIDNTPFLYRSIKE